MWLWFFACGDDQVGQLQSSTGTPLASVPVVSGTTQAVTGSDGGWRVPVGAPVTFTFAGVDYTARAPRETPFRLPAMRKVEVRCPVDAACDVLLGFGEHDGLDAALRHACSPGEAFEIHAPNHEPVATCEAGRPLFVDNREDRIDLLPVGREARIAIVPVEGELPPDCEAWVDTVPVRRVEPGVFVGQALGVAWAGGRCDGRALPPVRLDPSMTEVRIPWAPAGPDLPVAAVADWATELVLSHATGWSVNVRPSGEPATFRLPALPAGDYRVEVRGAHPKMGTTVSWPPASRDGLVLLPAGQQVLLGTWRVPEGAAPGLVAVDGPVQRATH